MLDFMSGYDQIPLHPNSRDLTALKTPIGLVRMKVLPQGYTNSVAIFQRIITRVLSVQIRKGYCDVFVDDVPTAGPGRRGDDKISTVLPGVRKFVYDHCMVVFSILDACLDSGLTLSALKSDFCVNEANITGFVCSEAGRQPETGKIEKVVNWPVPKNVSELRGFLALANIYRKWILHFSHHAESLNCLLRKSVAYHWTSEQMTSFEFLKKALTTAPILQSPDFSKIFIICSDASPVASGCVLLQEYSDGRHPIRFDSKTFNKRQRDYPQVKS
jgi:hypothetical protein